MGFAFGQVGLEAIEAATPHLPVRLEPGVQLDQRLWPQAIEPTLPVDTHLDQTGLAQDPQMLGHQRLAAAELLDERTHRCLTLAQSVEDATPARFGKRVENIRHEMSMP